MSLVLSLQSGDQITVADLLLTLHASPPRLVAGDKIFPLSDADTALPHGVTISLAPPMTSAKPSALSLRFTAPRHVTITRIRGSHAE